MCITELKFLPMKTTDSKRHETCIDFTDERRSINFLLILFKLNVIKFGIFNIFDIFYTPGATIISSKSNTKTHSKY